MTDNFLAQDDKQILKQAAEILDSLRKGLKVSVPVSINSGHGLLSYENKLRSNKQDL